MYRSVAQARLLGAFWIACTGHHWSVWHSLVNFGVILRYFLCQKMWVPLSGLIESSKVASPAKFASRIQSRNPGKSKRLSNPEENWVFWLFQKEVLIVPEQHLSNLFLFPPLNDVDAKTQATLLPQNFTREKNFFNFSTITWWCVYEAMYTDEVIWKFSTSFVFCHRSSSYFQQRLMKGDKPSSSTTWNYFRMYEGTGLFVQYPVPFYFVSLLMTKIMLEVGILTLAFRNLQNLLCKLV